MTELQAAFDRLAFILYKITQGDHAAIENAEGALDDVAHLIDDEEIRSLVKGDE